MTTQPQPRSSQISDGRGILENLGAALLMGALLITKPLTYRWVENWGTTGDEARRALPGDEYVPHYLSQYTHAVTIHAPPKAIWPWIVQLGQERGGLYSYERLENLARCQIHNASRIVPEFQHLEAGDRVRLGPKGYPLFRVAAFEPGRYVVWMAADLKTEAMLTYTDPMPADYDRSHMALILEPRDAHTTRLLLRGRLDYQPPTLLRRLMWGVTDVIGFVMMRRMLRGIKERAEANPVV